VPIIHTSQDFDELTTDPMQFQHLSIQLAGRIRGAKTTNGGVTFLAEWVPFPNNTYAGPETRSLPRSHRLFFMHFSGIVDEEGKSQGNEFLLFGRMTGLENMVTLQGNVRSIPAFHVHCLHMWKTAATDLYEFIWMHDDRYPPPLEETYCIPHQAKLKDP
jgi:hypothetical protein